MTDIIHHILHIHYAMVLFFNFFSRSQYTFFHFLTHFKLNTLNSHFKLVNSYFGLNFTILKPIDAHVRGRAGGLTTPLQRLISTFFIC